MAVVLGHSTTAASASTAETSLSFSHDCTGDNYLLVSCAFRLNCSNPTATYNGVSMTLLGSRQTGGDGIEFIYLFGLSNPATGSNTVAISWTNDRGLATIAASFSGVNAVGSVTDGDGGDSGGSYHTTTATGTLTSADDILFGFLGGNEYVANLSVTQGTEIAEVIQSSWVTNGNAYNTGTGSIDIKWSCRFGTIWMAIPLLSEAPSEFDVTISTIASKTIKVIKNTLSTASFTLSASKSLSKTFIGAIISVNSTTSKFIKKTINATINLSSLDNKKTEIEFDAKTYNTEKHYENESASWGYVYGDSNSRTTYLTSGWGSSIPRCKHLHNWDLSSMQISNIVSAKYHYNIVTAGNDGGVRIHKCISAWTSGTSANTFSGYDAGVYATGWSNSLGWQNVDITTIYNDWVDGDAKEGVYIRDYVNAASIPYMASRHYTSDPAKVPYLEVTYTTPGFDLSSSKSKRISKVLNAGIALSTEHNIATEKELEASVNLSSSGENKIEIEFEASATVSASKSIFIKKAAQNVTIQISSGGKLINFIVNAGIKLGAAFREEVTTTVLWLRAAFCWMKNRGMATSMTLTPNVIIFVKKFLETSFEISGGKGKDIYCLLETTLIITIGKAEKMVGKIAQATISMSSSLIKHIVNIIEATIVMSASITKSMKVFISAALILTAEKFLRFIRDVLQATVSMSSNVIRRTVNLLETTITMSPSITKYIEKSISATFSLLASIYKFTKIILESTLSLVEKAAKRIYITIRIALSSSSGKPSIFTWKWSGDTDQSDDDTFRDDNISDDTGGGEGRRS